MMRTGFDGIDHVFGGMRCSDVIVIGGRPGMGKTSFALDAAVYSVYTEGEKVSIFTTQNEVENVRNGLAARGWQDTDANLSIYSHEILSVSWIEEKLDADNTDIVIIDDLQHIGRSKKKKAAQMISIVRQIKEIAKAYHVPILLLTDISRRIEYRNDHRPHLKDVPSYESVISYIDSILLLYREAYYDMDARRDKAQCYIVHNRRGELGDIPLKWHDDRNGFSNEN